MVLNEQTEQVLQAVMRQIGTKALNSLVGTCELLPPTHLRADAGVYPTRMLSRSLDLFQDHCCLKGPSLDGRSCSPYTTGINYQ